MIEVLAPGLLTTVQDKGRAGFAHLGVPRAGAVDLLHLTLANKLVGNAAHAAALEITLNGPRLHFHKASVIALCGAPIEASLDGEPVALGQTHAVQAGQRLTLKQVRTGMRCYLAVAGGIQVPMQLGSRAADTASDLGPAVLRRGDRLPIREHLHYQPRYLRKAPALSRSTLRFIPGPHQGWFPHSALTTLQAHPYQIDAASDRSGLRLTGAHLERKTRELASQGMVAGAIQVPPDGQPILLLANHGTTGGYPIIGTLISADLPLAAQVRPGQLIRFKAVTPAAAQGALKQQATYLHNAVVLCDEEMLALRQLLQLTEQADAACDVTVQQAKWRVRITRQ